MAKLKQLQMHNDKTIYMIMGQKENVMKIKNEIDNDPIYFGEFETKNKKEEKWLGDQFSDEGLKQSVEATIKKRSGKIKAAIFEVKQIIEDFRMQSVGGLLGALDIWEMAVVQSLLNNSEVWVDISEESTKTLGDLQNLFLGLILDAPRTTGKPALLW